MKKTSKIIITSFLVLFLGTTIAGVTDHGDGEVSCDNQCAVTSGPFGLIKICDVGTDSCIYKFGRVTIRQK